MIQNSTHSFFYFSQRDLNQVTILVVPTKRQLLSKDIIIIPQPLCDFVNTCLTSKVEPATVSVCKHKQVLKVFNCMKA